MSEPTSLTSKERCTHAVYDPASGKLLGYQADAIAGCVACEIDRLTRERDKARRDAKRWEKAYDRAWAQVPGGATATAVTGEQGSGTVYIGASSDETEDDRLEHAKVILDEVLAERGRQVYRLGWSPEHDDEHDEAELASAAACYALNAACLSHPMNGTSMDAETAKAHGWPWAEPHWKPKDARRDLIRAGALIIAELERLDRSAEKAGESRGA